jgi:hypothetical protein
MNPSHTQPASPPRSDAGADGADPDPRENVAASRTDTPATPGADKVARGNTRATDQTAGGAGTQERRDDRTRDDPVGIGKRAHDDAAGDTQDTSLAPVTDKVYNDKVKP